MGRKNNARRRPQARRGRDGATLRGHRPPPPSVEALVVPLGRCFHRSRRGKYRFAAHDVDRALRQAQASRARKGSGYVESRAYQCDGCGDWHLTSRQEWNERGTA